MAKRIKWSPQAADDLEDIYRYISRNSVYYASLLVKRINSIVKDIPKFPKAGRMVPEFQDQNLRERIFQNYRIVYRLKNDLIEIVTIAHCAQLLKI